MLECCGWLIKRERSWTGGFRDVFRTREFESGDVPTRDERAQRHRHRRVRAGSLRGVTVDSGSPLTTTRFRCRNNTDYVIGLRPVASRPPLCMVRSSPRLLPALILLYSSVQDEMDRGPLPRRGQNPDFDVYCDSIFNNLDPEDADFGEMRRALWATWRTAPPTGGGAAHREQRDDEDDELQA